MGDIGVSISEVVEVRGSGLNDDELLALIIIACEVLSKAPSGVFSPAHVFVHTEGDLEIKIVTPKEVSQQYIPPELQEDSDVDAGAVHVFCLGEVLRFAGAETSENADLFSLLNVMTVSHVGTRPSITRLAQMAKNKLKIQNPKALLAEMYVLVMGEEGEDEDFDVSSGEYVLDELGENGEMKQISFSSHDIIGSPTFNSTKVADMENNFDGNKDLEKEWLKTSKYMDPFEEDDSTNLATLSGRDPFNNEFVETLSGPESSLSPQGEQQEKEGSEGSLQTEEEPKQKQRKLLVDASAMLMGSPEIEFSNKIEKPLRKKPLWSSIAKKYHAFDYDDEDIVEYKEDGEEGKKDQDLSSEALDRLTAISSQDTLPLSTIKEANEQNEKVTEHEVTSSSISSFEKNEPFGSSEVLTSERKNHSEMKRESKEEFLESETSKSDKENEVISSHIEAIVVEKVQPPSAIEDHVNTPVKETKETMSADEVPSSSAAQQFVRRNSLVPSRISGRKPSLRHNKRKLKAEPEFITNMNAPLVRLKAPAMRKKKVTLHRVEQTVVLVELLNGKRVEVNCRSDAVAAEIADVVMRHVNFNENIFFGLTVLRDGEHFFFDDNQKIEKFAPPGWKNGRQHGYSSRTYTLHLRFRFYPASLQFIRTDVVLLELYFQLRRDILDDCLQPSKEIAHELAALALQSEFGDRSLPQTLDYFLLEHYLSRRHIETNNERQIRDALAELHGRCKGISAEEARNKFINVCQRLPDYGAHFHRVFRSKPSSNLGNTPLGDPETGTAQWIAIMPRGIVEYEEQRGGRHPTVQHLWQNTQTLQFDKKQFVIVSDVHKPSHSIFYTDHYTKSAYFVRFAASQHRFMIKMRHWRQTLQNESTLRNRNIPDVGAEGTSSATNNLCLQESRASAQLSKRLNENNLSMVSDNVDSQVPFNADGRLKPEQIIDVSLASQDRFSEPNNNETVNANLCDRLEEASTEGSLESEDGRKFEVVLEKDPNLGLGLTLVDGNLNGIKGVYVKAVAEGGSGKKNGITGGDRLLSVNGVSLIGKDRHETVELVKKSGTTVALEVFRLDSVSSALLPNKKRTEQSPSHMRSISSTPNGVVARSRTPPLARKNVNALKKRVRAVSDFGAVGDTLPDLKSEDVIANISSNTRLKPLEHSPSEEEEVTRDRFRLPASTIYKFESVDEENILLKSPTSPGGHSSPFDEISPYVSSNHKLLNGIDKKSKEADALVNRSILKETDTNQLRSKNLDWTDGLNTPHGLGSNLVLVELQRNETGSLGVQIASSGGSVYIKQLTADPALSHPEVKMGDRLVQVNGKKTENLTHQQVVELLRNSGENVSLVLQHPEENGYSHSEEDKEKTIRVVLEKSSTGSLGLSLAKKTGYDGIFIRMIGTGSAADIDGTLLVGDKIWEVNGLSVINYNPGAVVELLKGASNPVEIVVKRSVNSTN